MTPKASCVDLGALVLQRPPILKEKCSPCWYHTGTIEIGFDNGNSHRVIHPINFLAAHIKSHTDPIFTRNQRQAWNLTYENLFASPLFMNAAGLVGGVGGANSLTRRGVEGDGGVKACARLVE